MDIDFNTKCQIREDIDTINHLISLKPFENISDYYVQQAIFTKIMIDLRDLVKKSELYAKKRVSFTDDILIDSKYKIADVSDLIKFVRDALCHIDSSNHKIETNTFSYCISFGNDPNGFVINDKAMGSDYADDFCIIFGVQKIYYNRHIIRAFEECKKNLLQFIK